MVASNLNKQTQAGGAMLCRLCLKNTPDMKARILAEGLLKLIHGGQKYDGRFILVGTDLNKPVQRPSGSYDRNILCQTCDSKLGILDNEAIIFCKRKDLQPHPSGVAWTLAGVDQGKLKLFCLSYIWRASITTLPEFKLVSLGDKHEEIIRKMIVGDYFGDIHDYSVVVSKFTLPADKKEWGLHVLNPTNNRFQDRNIVDLYLPNLYKIKVKVDKQPFNETLTKFSLGVEKDLIILDMGDYRKSQEFSIMHKAIMKGSK